MQMSILLTASCLYLQSAHNQLSLLEAMKATCHALIYHLIFFYNNIYNGILLFTRTFLQKFQNSLTI